MPFVKWNCEIRGLLNNTEYFYIVFFFGENKIEGIEFIGKQIQAKV